MTGYLNKWVGFAIAAVLVAATPSVAHAAQVKDARVWSGPEYTRVVLDAAGPLRYTIEQKDGQIVVDLPDSHVTREFAEPSAQGLFRGMRHANVGDHLQLTATVDPSSSLKSFVLKPTSGDDYRLVLDFYPANGNAASNAAAGTAATPVAVAPHSAPVASAPAPVPNSNPTHSGRVAAVQAAEMLNGQRQVVICIDAGHGGKDSGAIGPDGTMEKNVTLAVARDLAAQINRQPGMKAVLTRNGDYFIPLSQRYHIARVNNADLFVSIHADSYVSDDARGSSVWVLSPRGKTNVAARWLADRQNSSDLIGGVALDNMNDSLAKVLLDMQQGWAIQASDEVAGNVLKALAQLGPTHRGYVEHANFVVLRSPDVPSILVETAFISNPTEERKLRDPNHQKQLAEAVMGGIRNYFESTPPKGTWFAAQAARNNGYVQVASTAGQTTKASSGVVSRGKHASTPDRHRVGRGESLSSIAHQYGISVGALKNANQMSSNTVRAGMVLTIPNS